MEFAHFKKEPYYVILVITDSNMKSRSVVIINCCHVIVCFIVSVIKELENTKGVIRIRKSKNLFSFRLWVLKGTLNNNSFILLSSHEFS